MIRTSESTKMLTAALIEFHRSEVSVPKSATNPFFKSKYADLWTIKAACDPVLTGLGLVVTQFPGMDDLGRSTLVTRLCHVSGEFMEAEMPLLLPKDSPQDQGSALTYARRYSYSAVLGIVADPDDDAEGAMQRSKKKPVPIPEYQDVAGEQIPTGFTDNPITREGPPSTLASAKQVGFLKRLLDDAGVAPSEWAKVVNEVAPPWPDALHNLSKAQMSAMIDAYKV